MTFMAAGARRFVCKNTMYCSIDGCIRSPLSRMIDLRCYSTTAIQILLRQGQQKSRWNQCHRVLSRPCTRSNRISVPSVWSVCSRKSTSWSVLTSSVCLLICSHTFLPERWRATATIVEEAHVKPSSCLPHLHLKL